MTVSAVNYPVEVATWSKNAKECVRVSLDEYMGTPTFSAWIYYATDAGDWKPSRKGLALSAKHLPALLEAVTRAEYQARADGLLS